MSYDVVSAPNTVHPLSNLHNPALTTILFAVMVKRLGGRVKITQSDIDDIAYSRLLESADATGAIEFETVERARTT